MWKTYRAVILVIFAHRFVVLVAFVILSSSQQTIQLVQAWHAGNELEDLAELVSYHYVHTIFVAARFCFCVCGISRNHKNRV